MAPIEDVVKFLRSVDKKDYRRYADIPRSYEHDGLTFYFDNIQKEPASRSAMRVRISIARSGFPDDTHNTPVKEIALRDLIARRFWESCRTFAKGGGHGGSASIPRPGQEITERSSVVFSEKFIEVRFDVSLPWEGRSTSSEGSIKLLTADLIEIARSSLLFASYKRPKLYGHLNSLITSRTIRSLLREKGLIAFIADGSVLPRRDDNLAPMIGAVPFSSPDVLRVSFETADGTVAEGMGIPEGLTAVIGASSQGKTTMIESLISGVYDHIPGDGRELVITREDAARISKDAGRPVRNVDISMFIASAEKDMRSVSADAADGLTSSAVSAAEAMEAGCSVLIADGSVHRSLIYKDEKIIGLLPEGDETAVPLFESMRNTSVSVVTAAAHGSTVDAADTVIIISDHRAYGAIVRERTSSDRGPRPRDRMPMSRNMETAKGRKDVNSAALSASKMEFGDITIKLPYRLTDVCEMAAVADAMLYLTVMMDGTSTVAELIAKAEIEYRKRISSASENTGPGRVMFRPQDLAAVINRHPGIVMAQRP